MVGWVGWCGWMRCVDVVGWGGLVWMDGVMCGWNLVDVTCVWMKIRSGWMRIWCGCRNV